MSKIITKILLWLFVINLGIAFGAGLFEARIVFPEWLVYSPESGYRWDAEAARRSDTGLRFWVFVTSIPLTLLTLASLAAAWRSQGAVRRWWLTAAGFSMADRIFTFVYFIPTMVNLMTNETLSQTEAVATAMQWEKLNFVRHVIMLAAWLAALKTFSLFYKHENEWEKNYEN